MPGKSKVVLLVAVLLAGLGAGVWAESQSHIRPQPMPLSADEVPALKEQEAMDLLSTNWGRVFAQVEALRVVFVKPTPLDNKEYQTLCNLYDASLEKVVAAGAWAVWKRILFFLPDRLLDCLDMVSGGVGIGGGLGAEVHVTRWAGLGLGAQAALGMLWYYNRNLTPPIPMYAVLAIAGPFQAYSIGTVGAGTGWTKGRPGAGGKAYNKAGMFSRDDKMVKDGWSDPFGVGVGWAAEIHPIEVADFFVGLFTAGFVDISRDDFANPSRARYKIGMPVSNGDSTSGKGIVKTTGMSEKSPQKESPKKDDTGTPRKEEAPKDTKLEGTAPRKTESEPGGNTGSKKARIQLPAGSRAYSGK